MPGLPLAVSGLRLSLGGAAIIDLPALEAKPGTLTVLSGPSGSGKSTLLYLLSGLLNPDAGEVRWDGTDLARLGEGQRDRWRRRHAGFIFQDFHLVPEMSPLDNVLAPVLFERFSASKYRKAARDRLSALGVPENRSRTAILSRGEQQRVAIARALLLDPAVFFADEPTASLDASTGGEVIAILKELARRDNRTVIAATHDPALLAEADQVIRLDHGRQVAPQAEKTPA